MYILQKSNIEREVYTVKEKEYWINKGYALIAPEKQAVDDETTAVILPKKTRKKKGDTSDKQ